MPSSSHLPLLPLINLVPFHFRLTNPPSGFKKFQLFFFRCSFSGSEMAKTRGAHTYRPRVSQGPSPSAAGPSSATAGSPAADIAAAGPSAATVGAGPRAPTVRPTAAAAPAAGDAEGSSSVAPAQRRYHTRVRPTPPAPSHPRPARRAPPAKRARTLGPRESSSSRYRAPPSPPYQGVDGAPDLSPGSIIRRPYFPCDPIPGNVSCRDRDYHGELYYDLPAFAADPGFRDSMLLIQRYHLEPFMVSRQYYYPQVVTEFHHTMTSRREANPIALHFSFDGRPGILRTSDITTALHLPVVLANAAYYRLWPILRPGRWFDSSLWMLLVDWYYTGATFHSVCF